MNILDRFIDAFSARDLKGRVRGVILFGFALLALAAGGGAWFLQQTHAIVAVGTAVQAEAEGAVLEATIGARDLDRIKPDAPLGVELLPAEAPPRRAQAAILDIDPANLTLRLELADVPAASIPPGRFDVRLILVEEPYWKMLW